MIELVKKPKEPLKIAFCGARSTGKTTLAKALAEKLDIPYLPETAREVLESNYAKESPLKKQTEIYERQLIKEKTFSSFVSCRSMIDIEAFNGEHPSLFELALYQINYDYLFYVPIIKEISFEHDSIRGSNEKDRFDENTNILVNLLRVMNCRDLYLSESCKIKVITEKALRDRVNEIRYFIDPS